MPPPIDLGVPITPAASAPATTAGSDALASLLGLIEAERAERAAERAEQRRRDELREEEKPFSYDGMISEASLDPETPTVQERTASFDSAVKTLALDATTQTATFDKLTGFSPQVERPTMVCAQTSTGSTTSTSSEEDPIPAPVQKKRKMDTSSA